PYQHLHQAKARAVEQGIPLIRVANTGISAVIDPWGNIVSQTKMNESAYLDVNIPGIRSATFYSKFSDWPILMFIFLAIVFCVVSKIRRVNY
ncbi:MAG: apolipoprotein N-acyltransferase, partial [Proteobacteria bacterium]|nr:apolipoprotein N-acyltransferase [Pseudomonadota bacterium]